MNINLCVSQYKSYSTQQFLFENLLMQPGLQYKLEVVLVRKKTGISMFWCESRLCLQKENVVRDRVYVDDIPGTVSCELSLLCGRRHSAKRIECDVTGRHSKESFMNLLVLRRRNDLSL